MVKGGDRESMVSYEVRISNERYVRRKYLIDNMGTKIKKIQEAT
jgi:hypothetical protein